MNIKPIRNDDDLHTAFKRLELVYQAQDGLHIPYESLLASA